MLNQTRADLGIPNESRLQRRGISVWRRHSELLPFFWCANGITSMLASVLGVVLSMQFGIANTYAIGVCFYVLSAFIIVSVAWRHMHAELSL